MVEKLPLFKDYHVDVCLKQFRKLNNLKIEFINFDSERGEKTLNRYIRSLDPKSKEFKRLIHHL